MSVGQQQLCIRRALHAVAALPFFVESNLRELCLRFMEDVARMQSNPTF